MYCLINSKGVASTVNLLGEQIRERHGKSPLTVVAIANGSFYFAPDLVRATGLNLRIEVVKAHSYQGMAPEAARISVASFSDSMVRDKDILVVDDIFETGATSNEVIRLLKARGAHSVELCTFLMKEGKRKYPIIPNYCGLVIDDVWAVGYGMDLDGSYRSLSYIGVPKETRRPGQELRMARPWTSGGASTASIAPHTGQLHRTKDVNKHVAHDPQAGILVTH